MRRALIIPLLAAAWSALGQTPADQLASPEENRAMDSIVPCLVAGLPEDWHAAIMDVNLEKPLDETGGARYVVARGEPEVTEPFTPCDPEQPAQVLIEARKLQPEARRGWTGVRIVLFRDGRFGMRYSYPK
jgi:hypothetical protein